MKPLLPILFIFLPLGLWAQTDVPEPAKSSKSSGVRVDLGISAGVAIPIIKFQYSENRKAKAGDAFGLSADVIFNKAQRHFYGLASARIGVFSFKSDGIYRFGTMRQGHYTIVYSYDDENLFYSMAGVSGGIGYKKNGWSTTLKTGVMTAIDMSGNIKTRFGMYSELFSGVRVGANTTLGLSLFYTNTWLEPTGPQYQLHIHDTYNMLSVAAQVKLRLPSHSSRKKE